MADYISYGIIPIFITEGNVKEYMLLESVEGFWGFPKGTPENDETPEDTAIREAFEESGVVVAKEDLKSPVHYEYKQPVKGVMCTKRVVLFPVFVYSREATIQQKEIARYEWVSFDRAINLINLPTLFDALVKVDKDLA